MFIPYSISKLSKEKDVTLTVKKADWMKCMYRSNVIEEENEALREESEAFLIVIKPYEIATFGIRPIEAFFQRLKIQ